MRGYFFSGSRFPGNLNMDMNEIATNLVAYPKLHYIFSSISPLALSAPTMCSMQGTKYVATSDVIEIW